MPRNRVQSIQIHLLVPQQRPFLSFRIFHRLLEIQSHEDHLEGAGPRLERMMRGGLEG
jgi:hypothetical protein